MSTTYGPFYATTTATETVNDIGWSNPTNATAAPDGVSATVAVSVVTVTSDVRRLDGFDLSSIPSGYNVDSVDVEGTVGYSAAAPGAPSLLSWMGVVTAASAPAYSASDETPMTPVTYNALGLATAFIGPGSIGSVTTAEIKAAFRLYFYTQYTSQTATVSVDSIAVYVTTDYTAPSDSAPGHSTVRRLLLMENA